MTRILRQSAAAALLIALSLSAPLIVDASVACLYLVPWFVFLGRANLAAAISVGFAVGLLRFAIILGPVLAVANRPWLTYLIGATYLGVLHILFSVGTFRLLRIRSSLVRIVSVGLSVILLDVCLFFGPLPADRFCTSYAIAGSPGGLGLIRLFGVIVVGLPIGALACTVSQELLKARFRQAMVLSLTFIVTIDHFIPRTPESWMRTIKVVCIPAPSIPGEMDAAYDEEADLAVLPENIAKKLPLQPAEAFDLPLEPLLESITRSKHHTPTLLGVVEKGSDDYRNVALLYCRGIQTVVDKRRGIPGCEIALFDDYAWLRLAFTSVLPVESRIRMNRGASRVLEAVNLRLAVNLCFDHSCVDAWRAWGMSDPERIDMLVCLAKLRPLGHGAVWEWRVSRRARRVHAIVLGRPLLYVSDQGSELVTPDGEYRSVMSTSHHLWMIKVPNR